MQVCSGRAPGRSDGSDLLTALDQIAFFHEHTGSMGVAGEQVIAMVDFNHIAVATAVITGNHHAPRSGKNRCTGFGLEIHPGVKR